MTISNNKVATIHYTLKDDQGQVIDTSAGEEPMTYLHGHYNIVPGLEKALAGKSVGDKLTVTVAPEDGYGEFDPQLIQELPISQFAGVENVEVGMEFHAETEQGMQIVEVIEVDEDTVTINGNHPLAGQDLNFEVEVMAIRDAKEQEISEGQAQKGSCDCC